MSKIFCPLEQLGFQFKAIMKKIYFVRIFWWNCYNVSIHMFSQECHAISKVMVTIYFHTNSEASYLLHILPNSWHDQSFSSLCASLCITARGTWCSFAPLTEGVNLGDLANVVFAKIHFKFNSFPLQLVSNRGLIIWRCVNIPFSHPPSSH